jgi:NmrA-like family
MTKNKPSLVLTLAIFGILLIMTSLPLAHGLSPPASINVGVTPPPSPPRLMTKTIVVAGASGYIGKSVVMESVRQGYHTVALVRDSNKIRTQPQYEPFFRGATVLECDVTNPMALNQVCDVMCAT